MQLPTKEFAIARFQVKRMVAICTILLWCCWATPGEEIVSILGILFAYSVFGVPTVGTTHCGGLCIFPITLDQTMSLAFADRKPSGSMSSKFNVIVADRIGQHHMFS